MTNKREKIIPGEGLTNWQSNPAKARRVRVLDTPEGAGVAKEQDRWDGSRDAKVYPKTVTSSLGNLAESKGVSKQKLKKEMHEARMEAMTQRAREAKDYLKNRGQ
jgi:hypothetical protein